MGSLKKVRHVFSQKMDAKKPENKIPSTDRRSANVARWSVTHLKCPVGRARLMPGMVSMASKRNSSCSDRVGVDEEGECLGVDVHRLHHDLEAVEAANLGGLHLVRESVREIFRY
jgi:hypothetical protein